MFRKTGRIVICSNCGGKTCKGTTRVMRRVGFHFCVKCWTSKKDACVRFMEGVSR